MGPIFIFIFPSFLIEHGPGCISIYLLVVYVIPIWACTYVGILIDYSNKNIGTYYKVEDAEL